MIFLVTVHFLCMFDNRSSETDELVVSSGPPSITALVAFSKGFACACGQSIVHLFEKSDDKESYRKTREIQVCVASIKLGLHYSYECCK